MGKKLENAEIYSVYARFFSSGVIKEFAKFGHSEIADRLVSDYHLLNALALDPEMKVRDFYDRIFDLMKSHYRNEYLYKNALAEKILLGRHSINTAFMLTEFRVADCIADVVVLNGTSHVYEIKSEYDRLDRLENQITAYRKIFDKIMVVTTESLLTTIESIIPQEIGIVILGEGKNRYVFRRKLQREAKSNKKNVDPYAIFSSLQRREYLKIIYKYFGVSLDTLPNTQIYKEAKSYFLKLSPIEAHDSMVEILQHRRNTMKVADFLNDMPRSLKAASLSVRLTKTERRRFVDILNKNISRAFQ